MDILVTGGAGYIGSHTCLALLLAGHRPVVADNLCNAQEESLRRVAALAGLAADAIPFYPCDIRDRAALDGIFAAHDIGAVVHFAGLKAVGESVHQPLAYFDNNVTGTVSLLEAMQAAGCKRIIFSSSATVYGDTGDPCYVETMPVGAVSNPYGRTKVMIEQILQDVCAADDAFSAVLLRYFNPIGAHESGRIGENPRGIPNNLMPFVTQVAVGKRARLSVYGDDYPTPDGTCRRDYIHVADLADGHVAALGYALAHTGAEAFNLGTGRPYSVLEVVAAFEEATGVRVPYEIAPRRAGDLPESYACPDKARALLGWQAARGLEQMCADAWRWQRTNPEGYAPG